jgi:hypothetical protein
MKNYIIAAFLVYLMLMTTVLSHFSARAFDLIGANADSIVRLSMERKYK